MTVGVTNPKTRHSCENLLRKTEQEASQCNLKRPGVSDSKADDVLNFPRVISLLLPPSCGLIYQLYSPLRLSRRDI